MKGCILDYNLKHRSNVSKLLVRIQGVILAVFLFSFLPSLTQAILPLEVVINEIAWIGTRVEGAESKNWWRYEWLELYNNTNQSVFLDGWKIELYRAGLDWSLELKGTIPTEGYFLIVASDKIFPNYDLNYSNLGGKLNNNGQKVLFKDSLGNIIDEVDCFSYGKWFAGDNQTKQTMERKSTIKSGSDSSNWQTSQNPGGTPKAKNSKQIIEEQKAELKDQSTESSFQPIEPQEPELTNEQPQTVKSNYPTGIIFNEILPSPEGPDEENEWIEIFNQNNFEVDLSNWQITDTMGSIKTYTFPEGTKIKGQGFLVLSRLTTKITLNNDSDGLNLFQPNGNIIDSVRYEKAPRGQSYNRIDSKWTWGITLTPSSINIIPALGETKIEQGEKSKTEPPKVEESQIEKELAAIGKQVSKSSQPFFIILIALAIAIFSGIVILILKRKLKIAQ